MKSESEPITDDEWLYRRVHRDRFRSNKIPFVSPGAFEPRTKGRDPDTDGISLYRADCLADAAEVIELIEDPVKRQANGVVKVLVGEIRALGLTPKWTRKPEIAGHVSIEEMSSTAYLKNREQCKHWMLGLAKLASPEDRIVIKPQPPD